MNGLEHLIETCRAELGAWEARKRELAEEMAQTKAVADRQAKKWTRVCTIINRLNATILEAEEIVCQDADDAQAR